MSVIQFLIKYNYSIPRFCYHGLLSIAGNCRVCVIDDKELKTSVSCALCYESYKFEVFNINAIIGVFVKNALRVRENIFEFLLLSHPLDCPICDRGGECELQDMTNVFGSDRGRTKDFKNTVRDKYFNITISTHMSRCITCGRCVRFLREIVKSCTLGIVGRGNMCEISNYTGSLHINNDLFSSNIIDLCPVSSNYKYKEYNLYALNYIKLLSSYFFKKKHDLNLVYYNILKNGFHLRLYYSLPVTYFSRKLLDDVYECVLCASCTASCPSYWWNGNSYLGPSVLLQSYRWIVDSTDSCVSERVNLVDLNYNISLCHSIGNCKIVCPKNLDPADRISDIKSLIGYKLENLYYY